jgi:rare lipoprotein A (peptidoglycan hydrolase)
MRTLGFLVLGLVAVGGAAGVSRARAGAAPADAAASGTVSRPNARTYTYASHPGTATFYGAAYQGRTMANGEPFDMHDATITASNGYPLGARLLIQRATGSPWEHLLSDREREQYYAASVVVTVVDRGDFASDVDLSHAAFLRLGREDEGLIAVTIRPLAPGETAP